MKQLFYILISIFSLQLNLVGQKKENTYSVLVGQYKCIPDYYENKDNSPGILSAVDYSKLLNNPPVRFPKRVDTIIVVYTTSDTNIVQKKAEIRDKYQFESSLDSININQIDEILKKEIHVMFKGAKLTISEFMFDIIYSDGERKMIEIKTPLIIDNPSVKKYLSDKRPIIYIGIWDIHFQKNKNQTLIIPEGFGWKINYH